MAKIYRFMATEANLISKINKDSIGDLVLTEKNNYEIASQLLKVLRVRTSDIVVLFDGLSNSNNEEVWFNVKEVKPKELTLDFSEKRINNNDLDYEVELLYCLPNKPEKLEFTLQKGTELGVSRFILLQSDFSQYKHNLKTERLEKIVIEASEQSERIKKPVIESSTTLSNYLKENAGDKSIVVAMERDETNLNTKETFAALIRDFKRVSIVVGPEGGFSAAEKALISELKFTTFSLGKRVLRNETAAIVCAALASDIQ